MAAKTAYSPSVKGRAALTLAGSNEYHARIGLLLKADPFRWRCLLALQSLQLPQGYIGAGFLRNCIWDSLLPEHRSNFTHSSPLNDIDVIYFEILRGSNINTAIAVNVIHETMVPRPTLTLIAYFISASGKLERFTIVQEDVEVVRVFASNL